MNNIGINCGLSFYAPFLTMRNSLNIAIDPLLNRLVSTY